MKDMETVNSGTAAKLKAAGFPQPEPQRGQMWWKVEDVDEYELLVIDEYEFTHVIAYGKFEQEIILKEDFNELVYIPTATDILRGLPAKWVLTRQGTGEFWVAEISDIMHGYGHENPAESAAMAWLSTKNK